MKKVLCTMLTVLLLDGALNAGSLNMSGVKAYPVPFNPKAGAGALTIETGITTGTGKMDLTIYDVNGDVVTSRSGIDIPLSGVAFKWSGYNSRGRMVKPGLYIIRVKIEDAGAYGEKTLRILVNY